MESGETLTNVASASIEGNKVKKEVLTSSRDIGGSASSLSLTMTTTTTTTIAESLMTKKAGTMLREARRFCQLKRMWVCP
jgi:hypothetical protein